ncbi:S-arrestin a [Danio aesculapii]|uniref:S-arrestin a n=1 Tax=Danio aesculapii TaxID=1142201 RepID=UPI0024C061BE|nr:S-arrestin a [Danio aesculapii]
MSPKNVVFKKISKDKSVGVYMGKRDFVDRVDSVDPVDGVILIDPEQLRGKKAYVTLSCVFRYGRDDDAEVLGISFRKEIYISTRQVYPALQDKEQGILTKVQEKLLRKLGDNAYPFFFEFPDNLPCSVGLQPAPKDVGKHCAVEFEVKAFCAESQDAKVRKRSSVGLMIRKVQYAPEKLGPAPSVETTRDFLMSDKPLHMEASLEKQTYYHGEPINVRVKINNQCNKSVRNIILSVEQNANVVLYCNDNYMKVVATEDSGHSVESGAKLEKVYTLLPLLANNRERRGIALDGKLKHEDTNLASSSIIKDGVLKEVLGIMVSYRVVVKLIVGGMMGSSEVGVELPFQLMHPKPDAVKESEVEEEMVFEEFKRTYLKGMPEDEDEGNANIEENV